VISVCAGVCAVITVPGAIPFTAEGSKSVTADGKASPFWLTKE